MTHLLSYTAVKKKCRDLQARRQRLKQRLKDNSITLGTYLENVGAVNIKSNRLYTRTAERGPIENGDVNIETINGQCILHLEFLSNNQISHQSVSRRSVSFVPARATPIKRKLKNKYRDIDSNNSCITLIEMAKIRGTEGYR